MSSIILATQFIGPGVLASELLLEAPDLIPARNRSWQNSTAGARGPASVGSSQNYPGIIVETYDPKTYQYLDSSGSRGPASLSQSSYSGEAPNVIPSRSR